VDSTKHIPLPELKAKECPGFGDTGLDILQIFAHIIVVADHPQGGGAAFELEDHTRVPVEPEFKIILMQSPDPQTGMPVWLAKRRRKQSQRLIQLVELPGRERTSLAFETRGNLNP
jgi:hypothetical protein